MRLDPVLHRILGYFATVDLSWPVSVLAAVSGGADSTCLVSCLAALRNRDDTRLGVFHLRHGIRALEATEADLIFVRELCGRLGLPLHAEEVPSGSLRRRAQATGSSLEDLARRERYRRLEAARRAAGYDFVATGHTRDDVVETQIMNFFRGLAPASLRGIPRRRGRVLRPLIDLSRVEIEAYLTKNGISWREDLTNYDTDILRNRVRHELLPVVRSIFPGSARALARMAERAADRPIGQSGSPTEVFPSFERAGQAVSISLDAYLELGEAARFQLLQSMGAAVGAKGPLSHAFSRKTLRLREGPRCRRRLAEGRGIEIEASPGRLVIRRVLADGGRKGYLFKIDKTMYRELFGTLRIDVRTPGSSGSLVLRSSRKKDGIVIRGRRVYLKTLLGKVERTDEELVPVVQGRNGILAVAGRAFGGPDLVADGIDCGFDLENVSVRYMGSVGVMSE